MDQEQTILKLRLKLEDARKEKSLLKKEIAKMKHFAEREYAKGKRQGYLNGLADGENNLQARLRELLGIGNED